MVCFAENLFKLFTGVLVVAVLLADYFGIALLQGPVKAEDYGETIDASMTQEQVKDIKNLLAIYDPAPKDYTIIDSTAYCACEKCCGKWSDGTFANGDPVGGLVVAADTKHYPMGTEISIPGYGLATVKDRGGAIKGPHRLDVYFEDHDEAREWGHKYFIIYEVDGVYHCIFNEVE